MSDPVTKAVTTVLRARFIVSVRLGPDELSAYRRELNRNYTCDTISTGLVFRSASSPIEVVVPWANVAFFDRGPVQ